MIPSENNQWVYGSYIKISQKLHVNFDFEVFKEICIAFLESWEANFMPLFSSGNFAFWSFSSGKPHKQFFQDIKSNWDNEKLIGFSLEGWKE